MEPGVLPTVIQLRLLRQGFAEDHTNEKESEHPPQQIDQSLNRTKGPQIRPSTTAPPVRPPNGPIRHFPKSQVGPKH
ncbi:MAG: hypothetical protein OEZ57_00935 [Nitrospirota bacterium]|nr:hypothetical protein [Nitrospirota bacterium]